MTNKTFHPNGKDTVTLSAGIATGSVALDPLSNVVRVQNKGPNEVFIHFGDSAVAATLSHMPIAVGATETFTKGTLTHVAGICGGTTDTATVRFTCGEGL